MLGVKRADRTAQSERARYLRVSTQTWRLRALDRKALAQATVDAALEPESSTVWEALPRLGALSGMPGLQALRRRDAFFRRSLAFSDVLAAYLALIFAARAI